MKKIVDAELKEMVDAGMYDAAFKMAAEHITKYLEGEIPRGRCDDCFTVVKIFIAQRNREIRETKARLKAATTVQQVRLLTGHGASLKMMADRLL